jgi:hypothetical protein
LPIQPGPATGTPGAPGADGATWHRGAGAPDNGLGANGDFYLRESNGDVYFKAAGAWSVSVNIKGPAGDDGAPGADGEQGPQGEPGEGAGGLWTVLHDDDFSTDRINTAEYTPLPAVDKDGLVVAGGSLTATDTTLNNKELYVPGVTITDNWKMMIRFRRPTTSPAGGIVGVGKYKTEGTDRLCMFEQVSADDMNAKCYLDWGTGAQLQGSISPSDQSRMRDWWLVLRMGKRTEPTNNASDSSVKVNFEVWDEDPRWAGNWPGPNYGSGSGERPVQVMTISLDGTTFRDEIVEADGHPYIRIGGYNGANFDRVTDWSIQDFIVCAPDFGSDRVGF